MTSKVHCYQLGFCLNMFGIFVCVHLDGNKQPPLGDISHVRIVLPIWKCKQCTKTHTLTPSIHNDSDSHLIVSRACFIFISFTLLNCISLSIISSASLPPYLSPNNPPPPTPYPLTSGCSAKPRIHNLLLDDNLTPSHPRLQFSS